MAWAPGLGGRPAHTCQVRCARGRARLTRGPQPRQRHSRRLETWGSAGRMWPLSTEPSRAQRQDSDEPQAAHLSLPGREDKHHEPYTLQSPASWRTLGRF